MARQAQPDEWSDRFRDAETWDKPKALEQLAREADMAKLSPRLLIALARALMRSKANTVPLLKRAQARHPDDFWLTFWLGNALRR